jgi:putative endonuclease
LIAEVVAVLPKDLLGRQGEDAAAKYLEEAGLRILGRNWRCAEGELDIVAAERRALVVCEVKTRSGPRYGTPLESISRRKRARLRRLAVRWITAHGMAFDEIRIDAIGLTRDPDGGFAVAHVPGVG